MTTRYLAFALMSLLSTAAPAQFEGLGDTLSRAFGGGNQDQQRYQESQRYQEQQRYQDQQRHEEQQWRQGQQRHDEQQRYQAQHRYQDQPRYPGHESASNRHPRKSCPPGLARKGSRCVPPGQAKKW